MSQAFSILVLIFIGLLIVSAGWWYVVTVRDWIFTDRGSYVLGEVEVVGQPELADTYKKVLPRIIIARLARIRNEANDAIQALKEARDRRFGGQHPQSQEFVSTRDLPQPFAQPLDISLKIADVDVGPILGLLSKLGQQQDTLEITASISPDGKTANVYGYLAGDTGYSFSESTDITPDGMADAAAAAIVAEILKREDPTLAALSAKEYSNVLAVLTDYARYLKLAPIRDQFARRDLHELNRQLREIALQFSRWRDLQWLAAEIAEEAEAWDDAELYYGNLLAMTPHAHEDRELVGERLAHVQAARESVRMAGTGQALAENRSRAASPVDSATAEPIRRLIGMDAPLDVEGQVIGVVGIPWTESLQDVSWRSTEAMAPSSVGDGGQPDYALADYVAELVQTIRLVALNPTFVFAPFGQDLPSGGLSEADLLRSVSALARDPEVEVILYAYGSASESQVVNEALLALSPDRAVVISAGNHPQASVYSAIASSTFVAGAVDRQGRMARHTSTGSNLLWAPGVDVPVISPRTGAVEQRSGTAYSAAITAAVVAILQRRFPGASPERLRSVLAETSKPAPGSDGPPVINVPAAIEALENEPELAHARG